MGSGNLPSSLLARQPRLRGPQVTQRPQCAKKPLLVTGPVARELVERPGGNGTTHSCLLEVGAGLARTEQLRDPPRPPPQDGLLGPFTQLEARGMPGQLVHDNALQAGPRLEFLLELAAEDIDAASPEDLGPEGCRRHPMLDRVCPRSGFALRRARTAASREQSHRLTALRSIVWLSLGQHRIRMAHDFSLDWS
jgi:hypothetical protein